MSWCAWTEINGCPCPRRAVRTIPVPLCRVHRNKLKHALDQERSGTESVLKDRVIYFLSVGDGLVKIGYSSNLRIRRTEFRKKFGDRVAVLAVRPGGSAEECELHRRFSHLHVDHPKSTEVFRMDDDLLGLIEDARRSYAALVENDGRWQL